MGCEDGRTSGWAHRQTRAPSRQGDKQTSGRGRTVGGQADRGGLVGGRADGWRADGRTSGRVDELADGGGPISKG